MNLKLITKELVKSHNRFLHDINNLSESDYQFSYQQKWNAGQHLDHIIKSVAVLKLALSLPKFFLKRKFGVANRASRTQEDLIQRYLEKLKTAKPTPHRFQPKIIKFSKKEKAIKKLQKKLDNLCKRSWRFSENELDTYILPHPLLGKLTLREMLYFTKYHVEHHKELLYNSLKNNKK